jgi:hypothetical protein
MAGIGRSAHTRKARAARAKKLAKLSGKEKGAKFDRGTSFEAAVEIAKRNRRKGKDDGKKA